MPTQKLMIFLIGMSLSSSLFSQETRVKDEPVSSELAVKTNSLKYYLSDLINPLSPAFQLAFERKFSKKFAAELSAGYVTSFGGQWVINNRMEGYLVRAEARLLLDENTRKQFYLGFQAMFKETNEEEYGRFSRFNNSYQQLIDYQTNKKEMAGHFIVGVKLNISKSMFFELAAGAGIRVNNKIYKGVPDDAESLEDIPFLEFNPVGRNVLPSLYFRIGVGVHIF